MAEIIDGKALAEDVVAKVKTETARLAETGVTPGLAVVIVGEDPASQVYVASKSRRAKECGFHSVQHSLPEETGEEESFLLETSAIALTWRCLPQDMDELTGRDWAQGPERTE